MSRSLGSTLSALQAFIGTFFTQALQPHAENSVPKYFLATLREIISAALASVALARIAR